MIKVVELKNKAMKIKIEDGNKLLLYAFVGFIVLIVLQAVAYFGFLSAIPGFFGKYIWWIFYLDVSVVTLGVALMYYASYKGYVSCMASMMLGMTVGMQTGMMLGAVLGATNGFFVGAMVGMILGVITGYITGKGSLMGVLQGVMSGLMGGTMGAMITVMMFTDHILIFMPFYMIINIGILIGFVFMYHDEVIKDQKDVIKKNIDIVTFLSMCVIATAILMVIMIYGPKSALFSF